MEYRSRTSELVLCLGRPELGSVGSVSALLVVSDAPSYFASRLWWSRAPELSSSGSVRRSRMRAISIATLEFVSEARALFLAWMFVGTDSR